MSPAMLTDITRENPISATPSATSCRTRRVLVSIVVSPLINAVIIGSVLPAAVGPDPRPAVLTSGK